MASRTICVVDSIQTLEQCLSDLYPLFIHSTAPESYDPAVSTSEARLPDGTLPDFEVIADPPSSIAVDIEGVRLCREGKVSILQLVKIHGDLIWLLDVTVLGGIAFNYEDTQGRSIRKILEDKAIVKLFYDVRNDADALYNLFDIDMKNVVDLQILEIAWRKSHRHMCKWLTGLKTCIEVHVQPPPSWKELKEEGVKLFSPAKGGSYEIFETRPLDPRILEYCAQDVSLLHELESKLRGTFGNKGRNWDRRVDAVTELRLQDAKKPKMPERKDRGLCPAV